MRRLFGGLLAAVLGGTTLWGCSAIIGLKNPPEPEDASVADAGGGKAGQGTSCDAGAQCASGFCTDGVCCESACGGTCESCALSGSVGQCMPIPANTDPDLECVYDDAGLGPEPDASDGGGEPPEAGDAGDAGDTGAADASDGAPLEAGGGDAGDAAAADDAAPPEAGAENAGGDSGIFLPEGGITSSDAPCAGTCNGNRACKFPDKTTTCGTKFCNTPEQSARLACNGGGRCEVDLEACAAYTCAGEACGTSCASESDCLSGYFCNTQSQCQKKLGDGLVCNTNNECASGFCVSNGASSVCCNTACTFPGATCASAGAVGQCKCNVDCGAGSCQLYYQDKDADGYGNVAGSIAAGTAAVGCSNASPPAGFVADHTDCDDNDANVHPGQTSYFGAPSLGTGTYDYDCDGTLEKATPEFVGGSCGFCAGLLASCAISSTCSAAGATGAFSCGLHESCSQSRLCLLSCASSITTAFTSTVQCGTVGTATECGTCSAAGGTDTGDVHFSLQQECH